MQVATEPVTPTFLGFPDVEGFHHIVKFARSYPEYVPGPITYRSKIKLHGTNAGVTVWNGQVGAQSRNRMLTREADNEGFAKWVEEHLDAWALMGNGTVFGEFCGPGIMKGTAINKIPTKIFAVFAFQEGTVVEFCPERLAARLEKVQVPGVEILPWLGPEFVVDFTNEALLRATADRLSAETAVLEVEDPWVKARYGVSGTAEGAVYYPGADVPRITRQTFSNFVFKAKGERHRVAQAKDAVQVDPEVVASIQAFVTMFVTGPRCEQGLAALGGSTDIKGIGPFIQWVVADVLKESELELSASGLTWDQVKKAVGTAARVWFMGKAAAI